MLLAILQSAFLLIFPLLILRYGDRIRLFKWVGPIVLSYAIGLLFANVPYVPVDESLSNTFVSVTVPMAILLLVLPTDFVHWLKHAGTAITSYLLCIVAVTFSATVAFYFFSPHTPDAAQMAGMLIGIFTGGTPNMSAVGLSLGVNNETFILLNSSEILVGGVYLFFLMSIAKPLLLKILPPFSDTVDDSGNDNNFHRDPGSSETTTMQRMLNYGPPLLISLAALGASIGISLLLYGEIMEITVILSVTTIGIGLSFIRPVRKLKGSYPLGEYILMIFCIAVGSLANFERLLEASLVIFLFVLVVTVSTILIHFLLAMFFKIDTDTLIITSAAGIFSPAFVPAIAKAIGNEKLVISGLTTGLIGYAIGSYLGITIAYLLQ